MNELLEFAIVEQDRFGSFLTVFSYPFVENVPGVALRMTSGNTVSRFNSQWVYSATKNTDDESPLKEVETVGVFLFCRAYLPEKYFALLDTILTQYISSGTAVKALEVYLAAFTTSKYAPGGFDGNTFDFKSALLASSINDTVTLLGNDTVILWMAVLMKKRIGLLSRDPALVQKVARAIPLLMWHRQDWEAMHPLVDAGNPAEIQELEAAGGFIAGFTDGSVRSHHDLFDVFVQLDNGAVHIIDNNPAIAPENQSNAAQANSPENNIFALSKWHKELANWLVTTAAEGNDQATIKGLAMKTKELLDSIPDYLERLKSSTKAPGIMERFVKAVARAEGITEAQ